MLVRAHSDRLHTGIGSVTQKGTWLRVATQVMEHSRPVVERRVKCADKRTAFPQCPVALAVADERELHAAANGIAKLMPLPSVMSLFCKAAVNGFGVRASALSCDEKCAESSLRDTPWRVTCA